MQRIGGVIPLDVHEGAKDTTLLKFLTRVKLLFSIFIIVGIIIMSALIYYPLNNALTESTVLNFSHLVEAKQVIVQNDMERGLDGGRSMSSRTMIKESIVSYLNGELSYDDMKDYVQPRFDDGARALTNLIKAKRVVGDRAVMEEIYGDGNVEFEDFSLESDVMGEMSEAIIKDNVLYLGVTTPVVFEEEEVARDFLIFNLSYSEGMLADEIEETFMDEEGYESILLKASHERDYENIKVIEAAGKFYGTIEISEGIYIVVIEPKDVLMKDVERISINLLVVAILTLLSAILLIYFFIIRYAKNELSTLTVCKVSLDRAETEAIIDPLTGAYNRRFAENQLEELFEIYKNTGITPLVAIFDIDGFKNINDTYGHSVGDEALRAVVEAAKRTIREDDAVVRWGGDEFVILAHGFEQKKAKEFFLRLYDKIDEERVEVEGEYIRITISIGAAFFEEKDRSYLDVINRADKKMYEAKEEKGNSLRF